MCDTKQSYETTFWGEVLQTALDYEKDSKLPYGWYWLVSLHYLLGDSIKDLQNHLPEKHPLQLSSLDLKAFNKKLKGLDNLLKPRLNGIKQKFNITEIKKIDFSGLPFENEIDFSNFIFPINVDFTNSTFSQNVYFNGAIFTKTVNFKDAVFCGKISKFRDVAFDKIANFKGARFKGYANFKGSIIKGRTTFQETIFESHAPRFYTAKFSNEMTWANIKLPSLLKTDIDSFAKEDDTFNPANRVDSIKADENHSQRIQENQNSYENTATLLAGQNKYHDQHFFFREEMRCRRELEGNTLIRWAFGLYEGIADYGYGIERALKIWFWHIVFGAGFIAFIASCQGLGTWQVAFCSISTAFANANPFVFFGFKEGALMDCYECLHDLSPLGFGTIRVVQTIFGIPILFLLLTTLRVRFRIK